MTMFVMVDCHSIHKFAITACITASPTYIITNLKN